MSTIGLLSLIYTARLRIPNADEESQRCRQGRRLQAIGGDLCPMISRVRASGLLALGRSPVACFTGRCKFLSFGSMTSLFGALALSFL